MTDMTRDSQPRATRRHARVAATLTAACALVVTGCQGPGTATPSAPGSSSEPSAGATPSSAAGTSSSSPPARTADAGLPSDAEMSAARKDVEKLTTKQLAGQVIVGFYPGSGAGAAAEAIRKDGLGGVIIMGDNVPQDVTSTTAGLPAVTKAAQQAMKDTGRSWPAVIGVDQEGGPVARVGTPVTQLPGGMAYGATDDAKLAERIAQGQGQELRALGVTMVFAPDADVTVGPADPTIGVRSPGSDPARVTRAVVGQVKGFQRAGLVPVIKHFPGHGSVTSDTHVDYAVQSQPVSALVKRDWVPFAGAVKAGAPAVMTAHIVLKDIDPNVPGTLSKQVLTGQLREKLGFRGLIVTDGMNMGAIVKKFDDGGAAAVSALQAGADVVLMPANPSASVSAIVKAVDAGRLSRERLVESAARIVATTRHQQVSTPPMSAIGSHEADAQALAKASITQFGGVCGKRQIERSFRVDGGAPEDRAALTRALEQRGVLVNGRGTPVSLISGGTYNAGQASAGGGSEATRAGGTGAEEATKAAIQVALDTPYPLAGLPKGATGFAAYGRTPTTWAALADILVGKAEAGGTLPVAVGAHPVGYSACS